VLVVNVQSNVCHVAVDVAHGAPTGEPPFMSVDPAAEPDLLTEFARRGALFTTTDVVCGD